MQEGYIKKDKRKKILLITDDIRVHSGVAQVGREMVLNSSHRFNWVQMAGAVKHPDFGKGPIDFSKNINDAMGQDTDAYCKLYPVNGYGDSNFLRQVIKAEKPDALFLITDPRYFIYIFEMENEIRKNIPIIYLNIWDDLPAPMYNREYYDSCDALFGISKQTVNINKMVLGDRVKDKVIKYIPHGLNHHVFKPVDENDKELSDFRNQVYGGGETDFCLLFNSRNIRRKNCADTILAWKLFTDKLSEEEKKKVTIVMHTDPEHDAGTDLNAVIEYFFESPEDHRIRISATSFDSKYMNLLYNCADGVILVSNAEGWGLSLTESMLTATPFIATVTGGMQDQMRFEDNLGNWIDFNSDFPSNHRGTYKKHGEWVLPVFPSAHNIVGSPITPYIYDDHHRQEDTAEQIYNLYKMGKKERKRRGELGKKWALGDEAGFTSEKMTQKIINGIEELFSTWEPKSRFSFVKDTSYKRKTLPHKLSY